MPDTRITYCLVCFTEIAASGRGRTPVTCSPACRRDHDMRRKQAERSPVPAYLREKYPWRPRSINELEPADQRLAWSWGALIGISPLDVASPVVAPAFTARNARGRVVAASEPWEAEPNVVAVVGSNGYYRETRKRRLTLDM